jgi:hypothetical protein
MSDISSDMTMQLPRKLKKVSWILPERISLSLQWSAASTSEPNRILPPRCKTSNVRWKYYDFLAQKQQKTWNNFNISVQKPGGLRTSLEA